jgi:hypothetical protein
LLDASNPDCSSLYSSTSATENITNNAVKNKGMKLSDRIDITPNSTDVFTIRTIESSSETILISVFSTSGNKIINSKTIDNEYLLDLSNEKAGNTLCKFIIETN